MIRLFLIVSLLAKPALAADEIVIWHSYRAGEKTALDETLELFAERHPDIAVRVLKLPNDGYIQKLRSHIPTGHGPDLFIAAHNHLGDFARRQLIDPAPVRDTRPFIPETLDPLARTEGGFWGWPMAFKSLALFYRPDLVDTPPATTDDLIRLAKETQTDKRFGLVYPIGEFFYHAAWHHGFGARLLSVDGKEAPITSPEAIAAASFLRRLVVDEKLVPTDADTAQVTSLFNRGEAAMVLNGPWFLAEIQPEVPFAVAPLPTITETGEPARPLVTIEALLVARGRARGEVLTLAEFLVSDDAARLRAAIARQPVANRALYQQPVEPFVAVEPEEMSAGALVATLEQRGTDPILQIFKKQFDHAVPTPTAPLTALLWEPLNKALRQVGRDALSPKEALDEAHAQIELLRRPLPEEKSPTPYLLALLALVAVGLAVLLRRRPAQLLRRIVESRTAYGFLLPTAIGMTLLIGVPFFMGLGVGFFAFAPDGSIHFVGFANFTNIIAARDYAATDPMSFYYTLAVTTLWTLLNVVLHVAIGFGLALLLAPTWVRGRGIFRMVLILPWAIPNYITALVFKGLFNTQRGAINAMLGWMNVEPVGWFDSFLPAFCANLSTNVWLGFPFMMVSVLGALQAIPPDLYDAARVDGANAFQRFFRVTLPQVGPALLPAVILGTIWTFNMFNVVFLVSQGQPEGSTDILVTEAYRWAFARNGRFGYAAAYSVVIFLILLLYNALTRRMIAGGKR